MIAPLPLDAATLEPASYELEGDVRREDILVTPSARRCSHEANGADRMESVDHWLDAGVVMGKALK